MRTLRLLALMLPATALLLVNIGCNRKDSGTVHAQAAVVVQISNCTIVTPDPTQTHEGDSISWKVNPPDSSQYTVTFTGASPVGAHSFPSSSNPQRVTPDNACRADPQNKCTYKYSLTRITTPPSAACIDPGVHVTPN
jgi:hypothetical protein